MSDTNKVTFLSCWLKASAFIYVFYAILGYGNAGSHGLAVQMGAGIIRAPLMGLIVGWIWWLAKR